MVKVAMIGVGAISGIYLKNITNVFKEVELVGVCDANVDRAREIADKFGCKVFNSVAELGEACHAVSVVVPTDRHTEVAMQLFDKNCDLLIEKPICTSIADAEKIVDIAKSKKLIVQVGHIEHFNPVMKFMEERVHSPKFITADRLAPFNPRGTEVGVVLDLMIHDIGVVLKLANSHVSRIEAVGVGVLSRNEDIANARIVFENGCVANLNVSRVSLKKLRDIRIFQEGMYMSLDFLNQKGHVIRVKDRTEIIPEEVPIEKSEPLKIELASFADCVINKRRPKVDAVLGMSALEVALEITRQIKALQK